MRNGAAICQAMRPLRHATLFITATPTPLRDAAHAPRLRHSFIARRAHYDAAAHIVTPIRHCRYVDTCRFITRCHATREARCDAYAAAARVDVDAAMLMPLRHDVFAVADTLMPLRRASLRHHTPMPARRRCLLDVYALRYTYAYFQHACRCRRHY